MRLQSVAASSTVSRKRPRVGDEPELGREVQADHVRIDGHVDELGTWADQPIRVGDQAAELGPDGEDQVRVAQAALAYLRE